MIDRAAPKRWTKRMGAARHAIAKERIYMTTRGHPVAIRLGLETHRARTEGYYTPEESIDRFKPIGKGTAQRFHWKKHALFLKKIKRYENAKYKRHVHGNPGQAPWQWGIHAWHKPRAGVSAMQDPAWRRLIRWINGGSRDDQHIDIQVHTNRTMHINGVFKHKVRAAGFVQHIEALPGATKISYENRER
jgi:hypothetical protein